MKSGLLWYDNDPRRPLEDKIGQAARRYHEKYGSWPNTCFVHPQAMADDGDQPFSILNPEKQQGTIQVLSAANVLLHHFWLGECQNVERRNGETVRN
jgi:hypothetical protein